MGVRVAAVGDNCIDVYLGPRGRAAVGGNALNVAVNLARLGHDSEYIGTIGDDANGAQIRAALQKAGVRADHLHVRTGSSWVAYIAVGEGGVAVVDHEAAGIAGPYTPTAEELARVAGYRHVHLANLADPPAVLSALAQGGAWTSYDFGASTEDPRLAPMDFAFFSYAGPEGARGARSIAGRAVQRGARVAIVTMGANGSLADDGERIHTVPAEPIHAVDTLGAGDSFIASFIASRLDGGSIADAMDAGSRAASRTCLHWAAWPQEPLPQPDEVTTP